jgi:hypothetical protein
MLFLAGFRAKKIRKTLDKNSENEYIQTDPERTESHGSAVI